MFADSPRVRGYRTRSVFNCSMIRILRHHVRLATPLLAFSGLVVAILKLSSVVERIASNHASTGLLASLGEGIDAFHIRMSSVEGAIGSHVVTLQPWIAFGALAATMASVVYAVRQVAATLHGPADVVGAIHDSVRRIRHSIGFGSRLVAWGRVSDAVVASGLSFARVEVLNVDGRCVARTVADSRGIYGFHTSFEELMRRGGVGGVRVSKDGYHPVDVRYPVQAGNHTPNPNMFMTPISAGFRSVRTEKSSLDHIAQSVALWGGFMTIPIAYTTLTSTVGNAMVALFGFSIIVQAVMRRASPSTTPNFE